MAATARSISCCSTGSASASRSWTGSTASSSSKRLHYFPFILLNLSASLANIDSAMEESAQNLGARGFTLFSRIVFPLALPGYVAGAALVFVKVFDDLATPLLLNVTNMLAPQAYLKITSVGITDPMGYVISVIMIGCSLGAMTLSALVLRGRDFATQQRGGGGLARRPLGRLGTLAASAFVVVTLAVTLSPHIGIFLLSIATVWSFAVLPDGFTLAHYATVFREAGPLISNTLLYCGLAGPDRRDPRRDACLCGAAHAPAGPAPGRAGRDVGGGGARARARHRAAAHLLRREAAVLRRVARDVLVHAGDRLRGAPAALCARGRDRGAAAAACEPGGGGGKPRRRQVFDAHAHRGAADDRRPAGRLRHELRHRRGGVVGDADACRAQQRRADRLRHLCLHAVGGRPRAGRGARRHRRRGRLRSRPTSPIAWPTASAASNRASCSDARRAHRARHLRLRRDAGARRRKPGCRARRVLRLPRAVGLRQDHAAPSHRGFRHAACAAAFASASAM